MRLAIVILAIPAVCGVVSDTWQPKRELEVTIVQRAWVCGNAEAVLQVSARLGSPAGPARMSELKKRYKEAECDYIKGVFKKFGLEK